MPTTAPAPLPLATSTVGQQFTLAVFPLAMFVVAVVGLAVVDWASWWRTRPVRLGRHIGSESGKAEHFPASGLTRIPAAAGLALLGYGAAALARTPKAWGFPVAVCVAGSFVAFSGTGRRVSDIEAGARHLVIRYARSPPFRTPWLGINALDAPRWLMGGWRVAGSSGRRVLMPTDLWGHERVLRLIVLRSGLRFDGRGWTTATRPEVRRR